MKKLVWICIIVLVALLLAELAGRLIIMRENRGLELTRARSLYRPDPVLGYAMKPGFYLRYMDNTDVMTNRFGWRDGDYGRKKEPGTFRVICIGDSRTFGLGVRAEETYPKQLERLLRARFPGRKIEVWNAGVPGYTSREGALLVCDVLPQYQPDLVIAAFGHNDRWRSPRRKAEIAALLGEARVKSRLGLKAAAKKLDDLLDRLPFYFDLKVRARSRLRRSRFRGPAPEEEFRTNVPREEYRENLMAMARSARENGFGLLLFDFAENPGIFNHTEEGLRHFRAGRLDRAEEELIKAVQIPVNFSPAPHYYLGLIYRQEEKGKEAEERFEIAEFGSRIYPHPLHLVRDLFRRRGILRREMSGEALPALRPIADPYGLIREYQKITEEVSIQAEVPAVILDRDDLREDMFLDADHPDPAGHRFLAERLLLSPVWERSLAPELQIQLTRDG